MTRTILAETTEITRTERRRLIFIRRWHPAICAWISWNPPAPRMGYTPGELLSHLEERLPDEVLAATRPA